MPYFSRSVEKVDHMNGYQHSGYSNSAYIIGSGESEENLSRPTVDSMSQLLYRRRGVLGLFDEIKTETPAWYNSESKEILGRTPKRWGHCLGFYFLFYLGLAAFNAALYALWLRIILNLDSPQYSGPEEGLNWTPGMSFRPLLDQEKRSTLIRFSRANDSQIEYIKNYMYDNHLRAYDFEQNSENGNFIDCTQGRTDSDPEKVCEFKLDYLQPCILQDDYGWADGQPCIMLKLNRVNNWEPEDYASIDEVPEEIQNVWKKRIITVKCFGSDPVSNELIGDVSYYPQQGFSFDYYPFTGQQGYMQPLVAAQFTSLATNQLIFITCKAYTKNMIYDEVYNLGMVRFELISD